MPKIIKEQPRPKNIGKGTWDKGIAKELAKQSKFYSKANKVLEKLGYIGVGAVLGGLVGLFFGSGPGAAVGAALGSGISIAIISILVASGLDYLFNKWDGYKGKTISEHMKEALWSDINWLEEFFNGLISSCD